MSKLLIATTNPGKLDEIRLFLQGLNIDIAGLKDINLPGDAPESGADFMEIAITKAKYYCEKSGLPSIADDGGLEIDALKGEPGIKSHRWVHGNKESTDEELISHTIKKMNKVPQEQRQAQLRLVMAFFTPEGRYFTSEGLVRGIIPFVPSDNRTAGFPYRSLLFIPEINKFYDHNVMNDEETEKYNHRKKALELLKPEIIKTLQLSFK